MLSEFTSFVSSLLGSISSFLTTEPIKYVMYSVLLVIIIGILSRMIHINA